MVMAAPTLAMPSVARTDAEATAPDRDPASDGRLATRGFVFRCCQALGHEIGKAKLAAAAEDCFTVARLERLEAEVAGLARSLDNLVLALGGKKTEQGRTVN
jgi:hypothetical protein